MKKLKLVSITIMLLLVLSMVTPTILYAFNHATTAEASTTVTINKKKITLSVGKTSKLKITGTTEAVTWSSSDKSVAVVSSTGKVTAKKAGTATITATVNNKEYICKVKVKTDADSPKNQTTVYGKVTAINGTKVTLALGTLNVPPSGAKPNDKSSGAPSGIPGADSTSNKQRPSAPNGQPSGVPDLLTLTGKTITITISDTSILSKQSMQAPGDQTSNNKSGTTDASSTKAGLTDITEGSILKVTYSKNIKNLTSIQILGGRQADGTKPGSTN